MTHDPMSLMMWVGAGFVFTPMVVTGVVVGVLWWQRKVARQGLEPAPAPPPAPRP